jgi:GxxExxY protein
VLREVAAEVTYKGASAGLFRLDLVVAERVIVEVKSASMLGPTDKRQLVNYLRATQYEVGLLLHFGPEPRFHRMADIKSTSVDVANTSGSHPAPFVQSVSNP